MKAVQTVDQRLKVLDEKISKLKEERAVLCEEYSKLGDKLKKNYEELRKFTEEAADIQLEQQKQTGVFDWGMLLKFEDGEGNYKAKNQALQTLFPDGQVRGDGYYPDTMQYALQIRLDKNTGKQLDYISDVFVNQLIPVIKPLVDSRKVDHGRVIKLMEPGLSEYGIHQICVFDDRVDFRVTRHRNTSVKHTTSSFREMLEYLQERFAFIPYDEVED